MTMVSDGHATKYIGQSHNTALGSTEQALRKMSACRISLLSGHYWTLQDRKNDEINH